MIKKITLILVLFVTSSYSATIKGTVLDKYTLKPVVYVKVFIQNTDNGSVTNSSGIFVLTNVVKGNNNLKLKTFSFQAVVIEDILIENDDTIIELPTILLDSVGSDFMHGQLPNIKKLRNNNKFNITNSEIIERVRINSSPIQHNFDMPFKEFSKNIFISPYFLSSTLWTFSYLFKDDYLKPMMNYNCEFDFPVNYISSSVNKMYTDSNITVTNTIWINDNSHVTDSGIVNLNKYYNTDISYYNFDSLIFKGNEFSTEDSIIIYQILEGSSKNKKINRFLWSQEIDMNIPITLPAFQYNDTFITIKEDTSLVPMLAIKSEAKILEYDNLKVYEISQRNGYIIKLYYLMNYTNYKDLVAAFLQTNYQKKPTWDNQRFEGVPRFNGYIIFPDLNYSSSLYTNSIIQNMNIHFFHSTNTFKTSLNISTYPRTAIIPFTKQSINLRFDLSSTESHVENQEAPINEILKRDDIIKLYRPFIFSIGHKDRTDFLILGYCMYGK